MLYFYRQEVEITLRSSDPTVIALTMTACVLRLGIIRTQVTNRNIPGFDLHTDKSVERV